MTSADLSSVHGQVNVKKLRGPMFHNKYFMERDHTVMDCLEEQLVVRNRLEYEKDCLVWQIILILSVCTQGLIELCKQLMWFDKPLAVHKSLWHNNNEKINIYVHMTLFVTVWHCMNRCSYVCIRMYVCNSCIIYKVFCGVWVLYPIVCIVFLLVAKPEEFLRPFNLYCTKIHLRNIYSWLCHSHKPDIS